MAKREYKKPRLSLQVEHEDKAALDAVSDMVRKAMPGLGDQTLSITMRAALRLGLVELSRDPARAVTIEPPTIAPDDPPKPRRR
ncbi:MAG: hypothetical protein KIT58_20140 [Planctomycetota bacterium]|nr:hypothetical protein [Planctomycetota bacterium]